MRIIKKAVMPDGTKIQLEDWSEDYPFYAPCAHISAYPIAKFDAERVNGWVYPKRNHNFRLNFYFDIKNKNSAALAAELAFLSLTNGENELKDFSAYAQNKELLKFI